MIVASFVTETFKVKSISFYKKMPSEQQEPVTEVVTPDSSIISVTTHIPSPSPTELSISHGSDSELPDLNLLAILDKIEIPREETLRDILKRSTGTNDPSNLTEVKLQVITSDISLQQLNFYMPQLTELNLDGSVISSLRDLGCGLRNIKILRVCRCNLTSLDGIFGLENLKELYAQNNRIVDLSPCSWLSHIKRIDMKRNCIKFITSVSFLSLCSSLEHLILEENKELTEISEYRQIIKNLLPNLKTLDDKDITKDFTSLERSFKKLSDKENNTSTAFNKSTGEEDTNPSTSTAKQKLSTIAQNTKIKIHSVSPRPSNTLEGNIKYIARFPPKVLSPRPSSSGSSNDSNITTSYRNEMPDIQQKQILKNPSPEVPTRTTNSSEKE